MLCSISVQKLIEVLCILPAVVGLLSGWLAPIRMTASHITCHHIHTYIYIYIHTHLKPHSECILRISWAFQCQLLAKCPSLFNSDPSPLCEGAKPGCVEFQLWILQGKLVRLVSLVHRLKRLGVVRDNNLCVEHVLLYTSKKEMSCRL